MDEEFTYTARKLDRDVVNFSQIRHVICAFKESLPEIFPGRKEVPKILIFAKTDSKSLERKKNISFKDLLAAVTFGAQDEDLYVSLANRLARLDRQLSKDERATFAKKANRKTFNQAVKDLLNAYNPDIIDSKAFKIKLHQPEIQEADSKKKAQENLIDIARSTFSGELNEYIENVQSP
ncbi:MAG: type restriction enzyme subunit [Euryarchaeota archaeon]|nr:type restriction enzyme subunit [Euryarchaeota archaeon]